MKRRQVLALGSCLVAYLVAGTAGGASMSLLGEQDFINLQIVPDQATWLANQSNETPLTNAVYVPPATISYSHTGLPSSLSGLVWFGLWDIDAGLAGDQVSEVLIDGEAQQLSGFNDPRPDLCVQVFAFPVTSAMLADGQIDVSLTFTASNDGMVGLDFSRLDLIPEPCGLALVAAPAIVGLGVARRRRGA
jgi:hypothetical protein